MNFPSIRIEGSIFSSDILEKIEQGDIRGQLPKDFGFDNDTKVKEEIAIAWADANSYWKVFKSRVESLKEGKSGKSETGKYWIIPLLGFLGYDVQSYGRTGQTINGKTYAISHFASKHDNFPVHIVGVNDSLDKKREAGGTRMSPHSLLQEYINLSEHLYAIVSNGLTLRLLRDSSRLVKLSYIEFDLEKIFEEDHFTDFAVLFRLLHASRMPKDKATASESLIEQYHLDALESGERIRSGLSAAVENSIRIFGNGFLNNPANAKLIESLFSEGESDEKKTELLHVNLLRLIYRILFLMVIEERGLVYPKKADAELRDIYYDHYSVTSLRKLSELKYLSNGNFTDLWIRLKNTFRLFENAETGKHLGISPLAGDLFGERAIELLNDCGLENSYLLECIRTLNFYTNERGQHFRVNYGALSVEEFGSVYEGLLEYKPAITKSGGRYHYELVKGSERSVSGSHYTPDELVQPLIRHSLDHVIEDKLKAKEKTEKEKSLLNITVCDVACGSGHILLNAARRIAVELAKVRTGEDQPNPPEFRRALKDVISNCIYGVDKNPLAVELCKVALWLESHNPGEPLNFLDHRIKCGDSIVGLAHREELEKGIATEAFKTLPGDDKDIASDLRKRNILEIKDREKKQTTIRFKEDPGKKLEAFSGEMNKLSAMPESTPEQVEAKKAKYEKLNTDKDWWKLKNLADIQVAQFFIPKTEEYKRLLITDGKYSEYLYDGKQMTGPAVGKAMATAHERKFFHWFLEFPEVMTAGGFDCVIGNPPFLGGKKISGSFGDLYLNFLKSYFEHSSGGLDLVTYFFRRIFGFIKVNGFQALISTNTICQGDSRVGGLEFILNNCGIINFAIKSIQWPGLAAVNVSLISIRKSNLKSRIEVPTWLNNRKANVINSYLEDLEESLRAQLLIASSNLGFMGSNILGGGFIIDYEQSQSLIQRNDKNKEVIFRFINADDINNSPTQAPSRYIINFSNFSLDYCEREFPECIEILRKKVKPERDKVRRQTYRKKWWHYAEKAVNLYKAIEPLKRYLVVPFTTKYLSFTFLTGNVVISHAAGAVAYEEYRQFALLSNTFHEQWAWHNSSTMGGSTLRYTPSSALATYPFPKIINTKIQQLLEDVGEAYYEHRRQLMHGMQLGLTKSYNLFHTNGITTQGANDNDKQTTALNKHLEKTPGTNTFDEAIQGILKLRELHIKMDNAVLEAYGWSDISLRHDFYEVDYLPENDRVRYTIHPEARREVLKRLLELNHKIHEDEVKAGLWEKGKPKKAKKSKADRVAEDEGQYTLG